MKEKSCISKFSIYAEYKPKLSALQTYITISDIRAKLQLRVKQDGSFTIGDQRINFDGITVLPSSCQGLQFSGQNTLQLRLNAQGVVALSTDSCSRQRQLVDTCSEQNVCLSCTYCQHQLMPPHRFARVLPLPSDNWLGGCGEWFCHGEPDGATGRALSVRAGDCLVGDTCIMLAGTQAAMEHLPGVIKRTPQAKASAQASPSACSTPNHTTVKCKRCCAELGTVQKVEKQGNGVYKVEENLRLSLYSVCLSPEDAPIASSCPVKALCALLLHYSAHLNVFRFLIEVHGKPKLLLWLLEKECVVYCGNHTDTTLQPTPAIKLLYLDGFQEKNKQMCEKWNTDLTVHNFSLPTASFLHLSQALINSTKILPTKSLNGFHMGYLKRR